MWRVDVRDMAVLDLRDAKVRATLEIDLAELTEPRQPCQELARRAHRLGAEGIVVPSAAMQGGWNLVVFPRAFGSVRPAGSSVRNPAPPR